MQSRLGQACWGYIGLVSLLVSLAAVPIRAMPVSFSNVVVFGDSLSDVGNTPNHPIVELFSPQAQPPYFDDRFSNGPVWVEHIAEKLGLPGSASTRSDIGGDNYAHGGARTGPGSQTLGTIDNLGLQISDYTNANTPTGSELFVVWGGGNNLLDEAGTPQSIATNMTDHITALANDGGKQFLVMNLPKLGQVPRNLGTADQTTLNNQSIAYNDLLATAMASLEATLGIDITLFDVEATFDRLLADPASFGFTNTTQPAYVESTDTVVPNPDAYVFWDEIHPTRVAHAILADAAFVALHEPGDFTGDGQVDEPDLHRVITHFGQTTTPFNLDEGDWDGDGAAGISELDLVLANWTQPAIEQVPEPTSLVMIVGLALVTATRSSPDQRRRRCGR